MTASVLVIEDDSAVRQALVQTLELGELTPLAAASFVAAKDRITRDLDGIVLTDIRMPGRDGFHVLDYARGVDPDLPVILLTGEGDIPMAVRAMSDGAFDFLEKPCAPRTLLSAVNRALHMRRLVLENRALRRTAADGDAAARMLVGTSRQAADMRDQARQVARTGADVLISGEPGTGTARLAEVIHMLGAGADAPFEMIAAAQLTPQGLDAALNASAGGTVFVDDVPQLDAVTQQRLGQHLDSARPARIIAGTFRDLTELTAQGAFNADLALKLQAVELVIPPLRTRPEDIPVLFRHYVRQISQQAAIPPPEISPDHLARLMAQDWPGNARALMNAAMRFAFGLRDAGDDTDEGLSERMARVERSFLVDALRRHQGQASAAARSLKLPRKTLYDRLARYGLRPEDYR